MSKTDKELAVDLTIAIIQNLRTEPIITEDGKTVNIVINELFDGCYKAISNLDRKQSNIEIDGKELVNAIDSRTKREGFALSEALY